MNFGFICIGAHTGYWINDFIKKHSKKKILLVEPVKYNILELKKRFEFVDNIYIENCAISDRNKKINFYYIKEESIAKLKKHWASGIGSFSRDHILNHYTKRFKVQDEDIETKEVECLSFMNLVNKYSVKSIDLLLVDIEGEEFKVLSSIEYNQIFIKEIIFEKKHLGGSFQKSEKFDNLKEILNKNGYKIKDLNDENCLATKNP